LFSKTIKVPEDFFTIKSAVKNSQNGDVIEVEDGYYFERNIVIDKEIQLRAKIPFGAIVYGSRERGECIFIVRAKTEISGFILKNSYIGISQRDSPDVLWKGGDLAFFNMMDSAIQINDRQGNVGSAVLENLIIENCQSGICTNDAHEVQVQNSFIANCEIAFKGSDHISYGVKRTIAWNCLETSTQDWIFRPNSTNQVRLSSSVLILDDFIAQRKITDLHRLIRSYLNIPDPKISRKDYRLERLDGIIDNVVGKVYFKKKDYLSSQKYFQKAVTAGRASNLHECTFEALFGLALVAEKGATPSLATDYYKEAIKEIDEIINGLPLRLYQDSFFEDKIEIYELLIHRLCQMYMKESRPEYAEEAFLFAEKSRTAGIYSALMESPAKPDGLADSVSGTKGREIKKKISFLQRILYNPQTAGEERRVTLEKLEEAEDEYRALFMRLRSGNTRRPDSVFPELFPAALADKEFISRDEALLEYFIGNRYGFAFLLTRNSLEMVALPNVIEFVSLVPNYLSFLTLESPKIFLGKKGGRILYDRLIAPFKKRLSTDIRKIIIVPDGILHYLPFETLISDVSPPPSKSNVEKGYRFLVEDYEICYSPSAVCSSLLQKRNKINGNPMDLLAVACPEVNYQIESSKNNARGIRKLAFAKKEILMIANYFPKNRQKLLMGKEAREEAFKGLDLSNFKIIHLAAHGLFDDQYWWRSGILLNRDNAGPEDGLFQPIDLFGVRLNADLVVLSSCQSGSGHFEKGEGLLGFSAAFFLAGANSILSSLWVIDDESGAQFMNRYYRHLAAGKTKGEALSLSKIDMMNSKYRHPFFWAPFILIGDHSSTLN
jgi:CHAT domain-containing protein